VSPIEFFLTAQSLVLALALARLLEGLYVVSESPRRYWVHTVWLFVKIANVIVLLWNFRRAIDGEAFLVESFLDFVLAMCGTAALFLQAVALTGLHPSSEDDWDARFFSVRVRFFVLNSAIVAYGLLLTVRMDAVPQTIGFAAVLALSMVGAFSSSRRVHSVIACLIAINMLLAFFAPFQLLL
jgi:hypothetical protein